MFLMNAPPVLALQSRWEAFGPPGSFRFPGCFSEAAEGVGSPAVRAKVHMIISTLQGTRAARGTSHARALPGSQRAERGRDPRRPAGPAPAACGPAADFDPSGGKEAAGFGPSLPDSDSDDSVDRDIEEAIQEYLKAKGGAPQPPAATDNRDGRCQPEPPQSNAPPALCPPELAAGSRGVLGSRGGPSKDQGSTSPASVSSEDSFEQSIRAEIEQFLSEKRQHETPKRDVSADETPDPGDGRSSKEPLRAPRQDRPGACKEFVFRKPPRWAKATAQPRSLRSTGAAELESVGGTGPAAHAGRPAEAAQAKGVRRGGGPGRRGTRARSAALVPEASDSSSDDGIEEAIRLYQREKRREVSRDPPQKTSPPGEEPGPDPATPSTSHSTRKTPGKKKPVASRAVDLGPGGLDPDHPSKPPKETLTPALPGDPAAPGEREVPPPCRADTPAELMCAEAILDISKAILPAPGAGSDRPPSAGPPSCPLKVPSHVDGDSSSVDSDDSIEQEIRTFLALKAQSGSLLARSEAGPPAAHSPLLSHGQPGGPKTPVPKTEDLALSCKRKRRGGGSAWRPPTPKKARDVAKEGPRDPDPSQGRASEAPGREGEVRGPPLPCRTARRGDEDTAPDARGGTSPGHGKAAETSSVDERDSSQDKSSSLDSDEDLDTAIKDLLRSKRKPKRRCRDPRAAGKRKVRFSTTEARFLDQLGGLQKDWKDPGPHLLKSCLAKPKRDGRENPPGRPPSPGSRPTQRTRLRPGGVGPTDVPPALQPGHRACSGRLFSSDARGLLGAAASPSSGSEDSSSVDSDDSIELEIRKFLAEKAKESASGSDVPGGGPTALGPGNVPRPEPPCGKVVVPAPVLQPGVCTRSQRGRGTPQPATGLRAGPQLVPPKSVTGTVSGRGSPASRRTLYPHKEQSPRGAGDGAFGQLSGCGEAGARAGSPGGALPLTLWNQSALTRSRGAEREAGPQAGLTLPWGDFTHQSRLQGAQGLGSASRDTAWKGALETGMGTEGPAPCAPGLATDPKKGLPFADFSPLLSTQLFHFGKSVSWGGTPAGLFGSPLSLPPPGPAFSAFREPPASRGPVFGGSHLLVRKEGGPWPGGKAPAALGLRGGRDSGPEGALLDLRYRRRVVGRDHDDPEAWDSETSELSDTSVEEGGPMAKGQVLKL